VTQYLAGKTVRDLAAQFGIHRSTVGKYLHAQGVDTTPPALHPDDVPKALELYRAGWTFKQIADKFGVSQTAVRDRLHQAGVPRAERYGRSGRNM
jgi:DNA-directed RNA polymerase specialized sigma24 family protein